MGNILSTLRRECCFCCCEYCKRFRCCCKDRCLTEQERIQIIYDQIKSDEEIWGSQV